MTLALRTAALLAALSFPVSAQDWTTPFPPHRIADNVYYVGSRGLASYLITTPEGHILINSSLETSVPLIRESVEKLGYKFSDIKILLVSHAHWDHCAGSAQVKKLTGAKLMVMQQDVAEIESGGHTDFYYANYAPAHYAPVKVDRTLHDHDEVTLGGVTMTAHLTPGHTRGCTTWTMKAKDGGRTLDTVIVGSVGIGGVDLTGGNKSPNFPLVNNKLYPTIADDYDLSFKVLKSLPCDLFLGAHGDYYNLISKYPKIKEGAANPFIDPQGYGSFLARMERIFRSELARQK